MFPRKLTPEVLQALRGVRFIAQHIKDADKDNEVNIKFRSFLEQFLIEIWFFKCIFIRNVVINLLKIYFISDRSRMEVRVNGFRSIFIVVIHVDLHWWHTWNYFQ